MADAPTPKTIDKIHHDLVSIQLALESLRRLGGSDPEIQQKLIEDSLERVQGLIDLISGP